LPKLVLGLLVSNPAGQFYYPKGQHKMAQVFRAGLGYQPDQEILLCTEYIRESGKRPVYCGGIECECGKYLSFRLGISSSERCRYAVGMGLLLDHLKADLALSHHPVLGFSPALTLTFTL
jgi:hypothetical protein